MSATIRKPQRTFLAVTALTVIAVTTVFIVYAATLMTLFGSQITVTDTSGSNVEYSTNGSTWSNSIGPINPNQTWYAKINILNAAGQSGVAVQWTLQKNSVDQNSPVTTSGLTLATGTNVVYASSTNSTGDLFDWGTLTTTAGSYRVKATVTG
jgi:hypothetical protein